MTPPNHNVVGQHARCSSTSQAFHPTPPDGEKSADAARNRQLKPVTSGGGSQEAQTPDVGSPALSEPTDASQWNTLLAQQQQQMLTAHQGPEDSEMFHDVYHVIEDLMPGGREIAEHFVWAPFQPPITPESLAELDMPRIINNPKLRHDVNFDRELHFRPNLDGSRGRLKVRQAEEFWKALEGELFVYGLVQARRRDLAQAQNEEYWYSILVNSQKRLPKIFDAIRDVMKTLVPDYDQKTITERLDVSLIMQEINNGVCDLTDLGNWLARVLKNHCAPMRDEMVDRMQKEITCGASEQDPARLVNGIRQLLSILEAMKLDVANHQIRHMRPLLVEDTLNFQRRYNAHRISVNKIDDVRARSWLENEIAHLTTATRTPTHLEALASGLLRGLLFNDSQNLYPQTFYLDSDRLRILRADMHSMVYQEICRDILIEMAGPLVPKAELDKATAALYMSITAIVGTAGRYGGRIENIAVEIMRIVLMLERRIPPFDSTLLEFVEQRLETDLRPDSIAFESRALALYDKLLPNIQASVEQHIKLPALHLQDRLVPPVPLPAHPMGYGAVCAPGWMPPPTNAADDLVNRFTHILVLHWQVWANLVYLYQPSEDEEMRSPNLGPASPPSSASSPMVPVAQAVYAPGRKWLPIGVTVTEVPSCLPTPCPSPPPAADPQSPPSTEQPDSSSEQSSLDSEQQQPA